MKDKQRQSRLVFIIHTASLQFVDIVINNDIKLNILLRVREGKVKKRTIEDSFWQVRHFYLCVFVGHL